MPASTRISAISVESKVLATLNFYATGSYQKSIGGNYNVSISQTMVSRSIEEVSKAINTVLLQRWIKFPTRRVDRQRIKQRFYQETGMPDVIGAVDCTHISILKPPIHEEHYINRKGYPSMNVQAICDYDLRFLNVNARYAGSTGDAYIWRNSNVKQEMVRRYEVGERGEWLLGDSGYANEPWFLLTILHAEPGSIEENYTKVHCRARCCIERSFGLLKARWRCMLKHRCLHYDPEKAALIINACAVLHNIAIDARLPPPEPLEEEFVAEEQRLDAGDLAANPVNVDGNLLQRARAVRAEVVQRLGGLHVRR